MLKWILWGVSVGAVLVAASPVSATGLTFVGQGESNAALAPVLALDIEAALTDDGARITEARTYRLTSDSPAESEATVVFYRTLSQPGAVVEQLSVDGQLLSGRILTGTQADALRQELVLEVGQPGPHRGFGGALFVSSPVEIQMPPGGRTLAVSFTVTEPSRAWDTMRASTVPIDWHNQPAQRVSAQVSASTTSPLRALYSPFHELSVTRTGTFAATGSYVGHQICTSNDLTLLTSTGDEPIHVDILPFRQVEQEGGYFMALLTPSDALRDTAVEPRDIVFVLDRSGSMRGEKMEQARAAIGSVVSKLRPQDSFAFVWFDKDVETFTQKAVEASPERLEEALTFLDELSADGGTNLHGGLVAGLDAFVLGTGRPRYLVLLTDGLPTEGETDTDAIVAMASLRNELGARIFTFGIGDDVNTVLLDRLSMESSGASLYIRPGQSVADVVESFFAQIASPVLANPALDLAGFGALDPYPATLPDLFAGQTTAVVGRYDNPGEADVFLRGISGGTHGVARYRVSLPAYATQNAHVPRIWATRHVGTLLQQIRLGDEDPALIDQTLRVAERFGVVTEFTNFVQDEEGNARMVYSPVPIDSSGSLAVDTSSSLNGYQNSGAADTSVEAWMRYQADRTFPALHGRFTDTILGEDEADFDLHFGSERYLEFARTTAMAPQRLSLARNLRFELHGRSFRVTDTEDDGQSAPAESRSLPLLAAPAERGAAVSLVEVHDEQPPVPDGSDDPTRSVATHRSGCSTASIAQGAGSVPFLAVVTVLFLWGRVRGGPAA
jgi:uncharacterized protein YegL